MTHVLCSSPNSDVTSKFTSSEGGSIYEVLAKPRCSPDDSTYAYLDGDDAQNQDVGYPAFSLGDNVDEIIQVYVSSRFWSTVGGDPMRNLLYVNGTRYSGENYSPGITPRQYFDYYVKNPDTDAAWIQADVEGTGPNPLEYAGCRAIISAGNQARWSQQYLCVEWRENETGRIITTIAQPIVQAIVKGIN